MRGGSYICGRLFSLSLILLLGLSGCLLQELGAEELPSMHWLEDPSGKMTFNEVRAKSLSSDWNSVSKNYPNLGFTRSVIWLSLPFENTKNESAAKLLEIAFPLYDSIDVYFLKGNRLVTSYKSGDKYPFSERPLNHRNFLFPYTAYPNEKLRTLVRLQSTDVMYLGVKVWESNEFFSEDQQHILLLGVFFGFLSIMLLYNLFIYFLVRNKTYIYYVWYTASIIYLQLTQKGLGYQYLWPDQPLFNHLSIPMTVYLAMASSLFFIMYFLDLGKHNARTALAFQVLLWVALAGLIASPIIVLTNLFPDVYIYFLMMTTVCGMVATIAVIVLLIRLSLLGSRPAQILLLAWMFLLVGIVLFGLGRIGAPIPMLLGDNAMLIGSTIEAALISFGLAQHIKNEREARMKAQQLALENERKTREVQNSLLKLQQKTTQQLEQEVKERTQKLETAMQSLTTANYKLDNLARQDSLTGLSNRRNFDEVFDEAWRRSLRYQQPISLLMADIDHFKKINDTYGHLFGDQCLMRVANVLTKSVGRPDDLAARFGGEEFIILLSNTDAKRASQIAEGIRYSIQQLRVKHEGKQVKFTISIGIATVVPSSVAYDGSLNENADQALYLAKESGRNRVVALEDPPVVVS